MTATTIAEPVRQATIRPERDKAGRPVRYYPRADRLEYRPEDAVPVPVLLWVKEMLKDKVRQAYCRWDGVRWAYEAA